MTIDLLYNLLNKINTVVSGFDDMPRSEHRSDLAYTEAVLHESMRLATVAPTGLPHVTNCDTSVGKNYAIYSFIRSQATHYCN